MRHQCPPARPSTRRWPLPTSLVLLLLAHHPSDAAPAPLAISTNGHHFTTSNGQPFFYLADSAWELIHRANREDAQHYLRNRARKGFTVIHTAILAELDGVRTGNAAGDLPFTNLDPAQPNDAFFTHVDAILDEASGLGLHVGLAPTWGDKINRRWGAGPGNFFNPETAANFGKFLAQRYRDQPVIWILGGERNPENERQIAIWRALAAGLNEGDHQNHLITYLPMSGTSSAHWFHNDAWLSFNLFNSGQSLSRTPSSLALADFRRTPPKPCLNAEPPFEDHPIGWNPANGWFDDWDIRLAAYCALLSGAAGHAYGHHSVWQFWTPDRPPVSAARTPWRDALEHPGAEQMGQMKQFFQSRPWQNLEPRPDLVASSNTGVEHHIVAARSRNGEFLFAYTPEGKPIEINLQQIDATRIAGYWLNPRDGSSTPLTPFPNTKKTGVFTPPTSAPRTDWLLLLEDSARKLPKP